MVYRICKISYFISFPQEILIFFFLYAKKKNLTRRNQADFMLIFPKQENFSACFCTFAPEIQKQHYNV